MNIEIADRLLGYRKKFGFSQEELAEKIGVSRQAISKWERGEASPDTDNLILLAQTYNVSIDELLLGKKEDASNEKSDSDFGAGEPDENVNYVKKDKVSFKKGIHVHSSNGDKVDISLADGIHVDSVGGDMVHIDYKGVHVASNGQTKAYTDENGDVYIDESLNQKHFNFNPLHHFPMWILCVALFLVWGFSGVLHGFALSWVCFLLIPVYHSLISAIEQKNPSHFAYPIVCVIEYMFAGFLSILGGWSLGWIVFLTIPLYYWIAGLFNKDTVEYE